MHQIRCDWLLVEPISSEAITCSDTLVSKSLNIIFNNRRNILRKEDLDHMAVLANTVDEGWG